MCALCTVDISERMCSALLHWCIAVYVHILAKWFHRMCAVLVSSSRYVLFSISFRLRIPFRMRSLLCQRHAFLPCSRRHTSISKFTFFILNFWYTQFVCINNYMRHIQCMHTILVVHHTWQLISVILHEHTTGPKRLSLYINTKYQQLTLETYGCHGLRQHQTIPTIRLASLCCAVLYLFPLTIHSERKKHVLNRDLRISRSA